MTLSLQIRLTSQHYGTGKDCSHNIHLPKYFMLGATFTYVFIQGVWIHGSHVYHKINNLCSLPAHKITDRTLSVLSLFPFMSALHKRGASSGRGAFFDRTRGANLTVCEIQRFLRWR